MAIDRPLPGRFRVSLATSTKKANHSWSKTRNGNFPSVISEWTKRHLMCKLKWSTTHLKWRSPRTTSKRRSFSFPQMWLAGWLTNRITWNRLLKKKVYPRKKSRSEESRWIRRMRSSLLTLSSPLLALWESTRTINSRIPYSTLLSALRRPLPYSGSLKISGLKTTKTRLMSNYQSRLSTLIQRFSFTLARISLIWSQTPTYHCCQRINSSLSSNIRCLMLLKRMKLSRQYVCGLRDRSCALT